MKLAGWIFSTRWRWLWCFGWSANFGTSLSADRNGFLPNC
jgi:hypothetical protein